MLDEKSKINNVVKLMVNFAKSKIYDEDGNEIIPPEGATGFVAGMEAMQWTFDNPGFKSEFIYTPEPYTRPMAENVEVTFKFANIPLIKNDTWYVKRYRKKVRMKTRVLKLRGKAKQ